MLTIVLVLTWALALKVALVPALVAATLLLVATFGTAVDMWYDRGGYPSDWAWASAHYRAVFRPYAWVLARLMHVGAQSLLGRVLLTVYKWMR